MTDTRIHCGTYLKPRKQIFEERTAPQVGMVFGWHGVGKTTYAVKEIRQVLEKTNDTVFVFYSDVFSNGTEPCEGYSELAEKYGGIVISLTANIETIKIPIGARMIVFYFQSMEYYLQKHMLEQIVQKCINCITAFTQKKKYNVCLYVEEAHTYFEKTPDCIRQLLMLPISITFLCYDIISCYKTAKNADFVVIFSVPQQVRQDLQRTYQIEEDKIEFVRDSVCGTGLIMKNRVIDRRFLPFTAYDGKNIKWQKTE